MDIGARMSSKGQAPIPKAVRDALGAERFITHADPTLTGSSG